MLTERTLWGLLDLNERLAQAFVWRTQMLSRWQIIKRVGRDFLSEEDFRKLMDIKKSVETCARDRNIVVHGVVNATITLESSTLPRGAIAVNLPAETTFVQPPSWVIFMGEDAGKNYPISTRAVETIISNVNKVGKDLLEFNQIHGFLSGTETSVAAEANWPKPL